MMLPVDRTNKAKKIIQMTYHLGRLTAYATIGLVFGLVGKVSLWQDYSRKCQYLLGLR
jgi:sulfite exporter TauE/SafE